MLLFCFSFISYKSHSLPLSFFTFSFFYKFFSFCPAAEHLFFMVCWTFFSCVCVSYIFFFSCIFSSLHCTTMSIFSFCFWHLFLRLCLVSLRFLCTFLIVFFKYCCFFLLFALNRHLFMSNYCCFPIGWKFFYCSNRLIKIILFFSDGKTSPWNFFLTSTAKRKLNAVQLNWRKTWQHWGVLC